MIVKKCEVPRKILALEAILRRIPTNHPKRAIIENDLAKFNAGFQGEKALSYYFSFLDEAIYYIFHDLRLMIGDYYFQMDALILSAKFTLIIEAKNMAGTLQFEPNFNQLICNSNGNEEGFPNPLFQVKRQQDQLKKWFEKHGFCKIPIKTLIVNSNTSSILRGNQFISKQVCKIDRILDKINSLENEITIAILDSKEIRKLCKLFLKKHTPTNTLFYLQKYDIPQNDLITGVHCPQCQTIPMVYYRKKWHCPQCKMISSDAHIHALKDYFYIIDKNISNAKFREFVHINSISSASKLLSSTNLIKAGNKKGRKYLPRNK